MLRQTLINSKVAKPATQNVEGAINQCYQYKSSLVCYLKSENTAFYGSFEKWAKFSSRIKTLKSISEISVVQVQGGLSSNCKLSLWASRGREVNTICTKVSKINGKQRESSTFQVLQSSQDQCPQTSQLILLFFHLIHSLSLPYVSLVFNRLYSRPPHNSLTMLEHL